MGRHAGHLAMSVGISCGATVVVTPEGELDYMRDVIEPIRRARLAGRNHFMVIVAEGVKGGAYEVAKHIKEETALDTRVTILGHVQRGGQPTARDRINATYLGHEAVMLLAEGKSCRVVALDGDSVVDYDINEALSMHKGLEQYGLQVMENMTGI
jgi:6-phosphofructokinase 1